MFAGVTDESSLSSSPNVKLASVNKDKQVNNEEKVAIVVNEAKRKTVNELLGNQNQER